MLIKSLIICVLLPLNLAAIHQRDVKLIEDQKRGHGVVPVENWRR